jgi:hypothetical protein
MKEKISIKFTEPDKTAYIELDDSRSPNRKQSKQYLTICQ